MIRIKIAVGLVVAVGLGVAVTLAGNHYRGLLREAEAGRQRALVLKAVDAGVSERVEIDEFLTGYRMATEAGRREFRIIIDEAKRNEPETAARADRPVPDSVRRAYRERRYSRERSGCAGDECKGDD